MRRILLYFGLAALTLNAAAEQSIPPALIGEWRAASTFILLRADGLCMLAGTLGAGGLATYDANSRMLTMSLRNDQTGEEVAKITALYDPRELTLTPREKGYEATYKHHSKEVPAFFQALDPKKVLGAPK